MKDMTLKADSCLRRARRSVLVAAIVMASMWGAAVGARAVQPDEVLADPALEARARGISAGLRCLVCQNQSIDDSNAPLARDLRIIVRERLKAGDSDRQVRDYLVTRFGEFVLLQPPLSTGTLLLWLAPLLLLGVGGMAAYRHLSRRAPAADTTRDRPLTPEEARRVAEIVDKPD